MTNNRIKEAEEAAKVACPPIRGNAVFNDLQAIKRMSYKAGYLAACEKCEGELPKLIDEAIWHFCGEDWSEEAKPGEITKFLEQFKTQSHDR